MPAPSPEFLAFRNRLANLDEDEMKALVERRHPEYYGRLGHWNFCEATYVGGREWFPGNIFKYVKEGDGEYRDRIARAYRFPHTREVVDLINKYIFKAKVNRNDEDASPEVQSFWKAATINRRGIDDFMRLVSERCSYLGRPWIVVDTNQTSQDASLLAQKESGARLYAYVVKPQNVLDLSVSPDGDLNWIKIEETARDDQDILATGEVACRFRLWTRDFWALFEREYVEEKNGDQKVIYNLIDAGEHGLGRVPAFPVDHIISDNPYFAMSLVDDIAYLDRAVANYLSNLDEIIQDQTFSQLIMPAQAMMPGDSDDMRRLIDLGTKRIFTYDASGGTGAKPEYISPDPKQASIILAVINKIINEIYHSVGMAGERTKQDNAMGIDNSSGVAKAFDFERLNAVLTSKAHSLQVAENTLCELVDAWYGKTVEPGTYNLVTYPDSFDVRGLGDELAISAQLALIPAPDKLRREQMKALADKLLPHLPIDVATAIRAEIDSSWPPEPPPMAAPGSPPSGFSGEKRQGQNNGENKG